MASEESETCTRCGAIVKGGTSGCHAELDEMLALHYTDPAYAAVSLLLVDAHALQHPEDHGLKNNAFHLVNLCWILEFAGSPALGRTQRRIQQAFNGIPEDLKELTPPAPGKRGSMTIADVINANTPEDHAEKVWAWAESVWQAWVKHHEWARSWLEKNRP